MLTSSFIICNVPDKFLKKIENLRDAVVILRVVSFSFILVIAIKILLKMILKHIPCNNFGILIQNNSGRNGANYIRG